MDVYSKMDGSAPVSSALDGVWEIQKRGGIDDQKSGKKKRDKEKKEDERSFEDGLVSREQETLIDTVSGSEEEKEVTDSKDAGASKTKKIDIII